MHSLLQFSVPSIDMCSPPLDITEAQVCIVKTNVDAIVQMIFLLCFTDMQILSRILCKENRDANVPQSMPKHMLFSNTSAKKKNLHAIIHTITSRMLFLGGVKTTYTRTLAIQKWGKCIKTVSVNLAGIMPCIKSGNEGIK